MFQKVVLFFVLFTSIFSLNSAIADNFSCKDSWDNIQKVYQLDQDYQVLVGSCGLDFKKKLFGKISTNKDLGYNGARKIMFSKLDNENGLVCDVYSTQCIQTSSIPNPNVFNTEHSWCQSWGATGIAKADLHHLYPVSSDTNSKRGNFQFCEVSEASWSEDGSSFGKSSSGKKCFEPRDEHKGALARAMFYFSVRYSKTIDPEQESFFRKWNAEFPVTDKEFKRNEDIFNYQGNLNPFVKYPEFADVIDDF
jgi:deoxyribonuclease-1